MPPLRRPPAERSSAGERSRYFYDGALFHGPHFQVIHNLLELHDDGARAVLATTRAMQWQSGPWRTEAAALDGALQLMRVWGIKYLDRPSLPTRVGACIHHLDAPADEQIECVVPCRAAGKLMIVADAQLLDSNGRPVAEMRDVEMHAIGNTESGT
jgi:Polyketide synthase dehydratase